MSNKMWVVVFIPCDSNGSVLEKEKWTESTERYSSIRRARKVAENCMGFGYGMYKAMKEEWRNEIF